MEKFVLSNGYEVPVICMGTDIITYKSSIKGKIKKNIHVLSQGLPRSEIDKLKKEHGIIKCCNNAISKGCNFFDTSRAYKGAERMLRDSLNGIPRENYYICTKLNNYSQLNNIPAKDVLMNSMRELGVDYIDIYLLHWPVDGKYLDYWKQLEELYMEGVVKAIGVSNCKIHHLEEIKKIAKVMPMIDEVELHPLLSEIELRRYCNANNIRIMAYTSTARQDFRLKASKRLQEVCDSTGKNLSQIILKWHIQNGIIPIFNTSQIKHLENNMNIFDFELTDEQMEILESININSRTRYDSDNCEWDRL